MLPLLLMMLQIGWNDHYWDPGWCTKPYTSCSWCCCWCWFYQGFLWTADDVYWFCQKGFYFNPMFDMLSHMNVLLIAATAIFSDKRTAIIAILFDAIAVWMLLLLHVAQFKYLLFTVNSMKWSNARCFVFFLNDDNMLSLIERFDSMLISMNMIKMGCPKIQFFEVLFFHRWEVMALHWVGPI